MGTNSNQQTTIVVRSADEEMAWLEAEEEKYCTEEEIRVESSSQWLESRDIYESTIHLCYCYTCHETRIPTRINFFQDATGI